MIHHSQSLTFGSPEYDDGNVGAEHRLRPNKKGKDGALPLQLSKQRHRERREENCTRWRAFRKRFFSSGAACLMVEKRADAV